MELDPEMTQEAVKYARKIADSGTLSHAGSGSADNPESDGENLAYYCSADPESYTGDIPVKVW